MLEDESFRATEAENAFMSSDLPERRIPVITLMSRVPSSAQSRYRYVLRSTQAIIRSFRFRNSNSFKVSKPGRQYLGDQHDFALLEQFVDGLLDFPGYIHNASHLPIGGIISFACTVVKFGNSVPKFLYSHSMVAGGLDVMS